MIGAEPFSSANQRHNAFDFLSTYLSRQGLIINSWLDVKTTQELYETREVLQDALRCLDAALLRRAVGDGPRDLPV